MIKKRIKSRTDKVCLVISGVLAVITLYIWYSYSYLNALMFLVGVCFMLFSSAVILQLLAKCLEKIVKNLEEKEKMDNEL